jgi:hypothetical protein
MSCYYCHAKTFCGAAVQPGSVVCMVNQMRYGGTHAGDPPPVGDRGTYCRFCGQPLKIIGRERFCNNPRCGHHYEQQ